MDGPVGGGGEWNMRKVAGLRWSLPPKGGSYLDVAPGGDSTLLKGFFSPLSRESKFSMLTPSMEYIRFFSLGTLENTPGLIYSVIKANSLKTEPILWRAIDIISHLVQKPKGDGWLY